MCDSPCPFAPSPAHCFPTPPSQDRARAGVLLRAALPSVGPARACAGLDRWGRLRAAGEGARDSLSRSCLALRLARAILVAVRAPPQSLLVVASSRRA